MGSNFNPKFRFVGPWKRREASVKIMAGELYDVVKRTGGVVFFVGYTLLPLVVFGMMSLCINTWASVRAWWKRK